MPGGDDGAERSGSLQIAAQAPDGCTEARDGTKIRRRQHAALQRRSQAGTGGFRFRQGRGAGVFHYEAGRGGFLHPRAAEALVQDGFRIAQDLAGGLRNRHFLQLLNDLVKTE